jgi:eukaryotic-like serine/threonine-protein kinase
MKANCNTPLDRVCVPRMSSDTTTGQFGLPSDMMDRAVTRLGWLALFYAATLNLVHWTRTYTRPAHVFGGWTMPPLVYFALAAGTILGLAICALAWSRRIPAASMLDLGLIFEVVAAFCIAAMENSNPLIAQGWVRGVSGLALWTTFFALVVPTSAGKTTLAALAAAAMGPLGLLIDSSVYNNPMPEPGIWLSLFLPDFLCAAWAVVLSRFIYGMGRDLGKARRMGYYELIEPLGRGGMGEVWRAKHRMLARPAAIKLISPEAAGIGHGGLTTTLIRRFEQEAQMTATLQSQHTIQLYDFGVTDDGAFYYVMEYLNGLDLETLVEKYGPVPAERAVHFMLQITDSLEEAHRIGLIHRDIKPANIFTSVHGVQYDFIKVLDFGLAKFTQEQKGITMSDSASGTPAFMAPEAALGETVDGRSDLYALGAVAYWLLTGRLVFEGETPYATVLDHVRKAPVPPSQRTELKIPESLERIIMMCLEKDPANRPSSAHELARLLREVPLETKWDDGKAERWWQLHRPQPTGRRPAIHIENSLTTDAA